VLISVDSWSASKLSIGWPLIDLTTSPARNPAAAAGLFGSTRPIRARC